MECTGTRPAEGAFFMGKDQTVSALGKLMSRAAILQVKGAHDAATAVTGQAISQLQDLNDADTRVTFAGLLGFFSGFVLCQPTPQAVAYLDLLDAAAEHGDVTEMRLAIRAILNALTGRDSATRDAR